MRDIPVVFHFKVDISGLEDDEDNRFQEVIGLSSEITTEELREGGLNSHGHRFPTGGKFGNLTLKRGFAASTALVDWVRAAVEDFVFQRRDVVLTLLNEAHDPVASWSFANAYPVKWSVSDFKAQENALAIESLDLVYATFRRV